MRMRYSLFCAALLTCSLLFFPACDDSSDVGLGVGPDSLAGGTPHTLEIAPDSHSITTEPPLTGRHLEQGTWRFLAGRVEELPATPNSYTIEAEGYIDFRGLPSLPEEIESADADDLSAELRLPRRYLHGDTSSTLDLRVFDLSEEADMSQATADTTFAAEAEPIQNSSISPTDSLITIDLPSSWVDTHLDVLQNVEDDGEAFEEEFHGFKLTAPEGNVVVGFSSTEATLRLTHEPDTITADFQGFKTFTHVDPSSPSFSSQEHVLLQDGIGRGLSMEWNFDTPPLDTLTSTPLNRAEFYIPVDTTALAASVDNSDFVRPPAQGFRITATQAPNAPSCSQVATFALSNTECLLPLIPEEAPHAARVGNDTAFPIFEVSLLETPVFTEYRIEVADRASTDIDPTETVNPGLPSVLPVLIPRPESPEDGSPDGPRAIITVTQL